MMSFGVIYKVTNILNNKVYIGQTIQILKRRKQHHYSDAYRNIDNYHFHNALRKYNEGDFIWEILEDNVAKNILNDKETYYINKYNSVKLGYNMRSFGEVQSGWKHSKSSKKKMAEATKVSLLKKGHPNKGKKWSRETRQRMSDSHKGKTLTESHCKLMSVRASGKNNPMYGMVGEKSPTSKMFKITYPDGHTEIIKGLLNFCKDNNLTPSCMYACAKNRQSQHKKFKCSYLEERG